MFGSRGFDVSGPKKLAEGPIVAGVTLEEGPWPVIDGCNTEGWTSECFCCPDGKEGFSPGYCWKVCGADNPGVG